MLSRIYTRLKTLYTQIRYANSKKVFCIGRNKTGTTSMAEIFRQLNLDVAPQRPAELLFNDWKNDRFENLINFVKYGGVAFQDIPFSLPGTYKVLDRFFPGSKFILTIRDSPEEWYKSLTGFHAKMFGNGTVPLKEDLQNAEYVYKGWMWEVNQGVYKTPENDIYNELILKKHYTDYNNSVIQYFNSQPNKLLVINLKESDAATRISEFLNTGKAIKHLPWENKT